MTHQALTISANIATVNSNYTYINAVVAQSSTSSNCKVSVYRLNAETGVVQHSTPQGTKILFIGY